MKALISIIAILCIHTTAFGIGFMNIPSSNDYPTETGWAKAMVKKACQVPLMKSDRGAIEEVESGYVYTVYDKQGNMVASAWAASTSIFAKKRCLVK